MVFSMAVFQPKITGNPRRAARYPKNSLASSSRTWFSTGMSREGILMRRGMDEQDNDANQTTEGGLPGIRVGSRWEVSCPFNMTCYAKKRQPSS